MKQVCMPIILTLGLLVLALPALLAEDDPKKDARPAPDVLAKKLIAKCAHVKDGDVVQITGGARDIDLLESLSVEAAKLGADPLLTLSPSDPTMRRLYLDVPAKFDSRTSPSALKLAETVTVAISIESTDAEGSLADIPAERVHARTQAGLPIADTLLKRNVRQVSVGNGLYPTEARAKQYGISKAELTKLFYDGLDVDYDKMQTTGQTLRDTLGAGKKLHLTTPEGTDLTVEIEKRPVFVSDGILSDDKVKKGGAGCQVWLPAGEVYLTPVAGTAEGKVVVERLLWEGKEVAGLSLTFKKGKLTEMKARSGLERIQSLYDTAGAGKEAFSFLDVGINPAVQLPKSSPGGLFMAAGTVTVGVGNNVWAGGENKSPFTLVSFLRGGTLEVDGKALIQNGSLQVSR
jgi:aminopeptidase